ncbi:MAG: type II toxin-antitoxin system RelE/ParE family toxin [Betaproteobacteria bacterium]
MAQVKLSRGAQADLDRLFEFLLTQDAQAADEAVTMIYDALSVLPRHPLIGRPAEEELRELVISHGKSGYVALYYFNAPLDVVQVVSLRHQREAGLRD